MRILIIGGTRFIGPYVVRGLAGEGHELMLFHRGHSQADLPDNIRHIYGDRRRLDDFADQLKSLNPNLIVDMIPLIESDAGDIIRVFSGTAARVVAISSQDVYREYGRIIKIESGDPDPLPLTEDSPLRSKLYPYRDKAKTPEDRDYKYEKILVEKAYMENPDLPATILRLPMVYGPGDNRQHRLFNYLKRMDDNRPAIILQKGVAAWRWTKGFVENVAAAIVLAVNDMRAAGRIYNVGETVTLTENEWILAIAKAAGWHGRVVEVPKDHLPAGYSWGINTEHHLVVESSRIRQELGFIEPVSFEEGLRRAIVWERANPPEKVNPKLFDYAAEDALLEDFN